MLNNFSGFQKICILGNTASGKTRLAKKISKLTNIPVTHVDSIQFNQQLEILPLDQIRNKLFQIEHQDQWIIDGYGPLDMLEARFLKADQIIFIDPPIYINFFWLTYRQIKNILWPRSELPKGSSELNWKHIKKVYKTTWSIHIKMRPQLIKMIQRKEFVHKVRFL